MENSSFPNDADANRPDILRAGWVTTYIYDKDWRLIGHTTTPPRADKPEEPALEPLPGIVTTFIYDTQRGLTGMIHPDGTRVSYPLAVGDKEDNNKGEGKKR